MLLTIHNLPFNTQYVQVKELIINKCGLKEAILDNLENEGNGMRVTIGVIAEEDAALLVRKINGLYYKGQQLYVKNKKQTKESDQPYRFSGSQQSIYPAINVAATMQQQQYQGYEYASLQQASMQYGMPNSYTMYQPQADLQNVQNSFMVYGGNQPQIILPQYNEYAQKSYGQLGQGGQVAAQLGRRSPSPMNQRQWPGEDMRRGDNGRGRDRSRSRGDPSNYNYEFNRDSTQSQDRFETRGPRQNDNNRGGHAPFDRDQHGGHALYDRDQGSSYAPSDRDSRVGNSSFNRESRGGHSSFNRESRGGHSSFNRESRGGHSSFNHNTRGGHSSFNHNTRGGHSSIDHNSRGGHSSFDSNSRGGHSSFDSNSRGGHSSLDRSPRGGHSSLDRNSRGGHSSFDHNSRGGHASVVRDSRGGHTPFNRDSRGGHTPFSRDSRGGHTPFSRDSRGGHTPFGRDSRGGHTPFNRDSRGGHTPFNRDSRDSHTSNDRREGNSQYIRDSRGDQGPNSPKTSRKRRWDEIPDQYEPIPDPEDEPLGIPDQPLEQFGAPMDSSYRKLIRFSKIKGAGKVMFEIARNLQLLETFASPNPTKTAMRKVVNHRVSEVVDRDILQPDEVFVRYRLKYPASDDLEFYNYIKRRVVSTINHRRFNSTETGSKVPNSKLEFVPNKTGLTNKERKESKKMEIVPRKHLRLPSTHPVNPEKIPNYPEGDKKLFTKLKLQNKEDMTTLAPYEVSSIYQKVMDEEASVIGTLIENEFNNPQTQHEKTVYDSVNKQSCIEQSKKLIVHHISRRVTNNGVKLVRVMFRPKPPRRQALEQLMAKHGCLSLKKSIKSPFYTASFDSYDTIDELCAMDPVHVGENIYVYFKHMHVAPQGQKVNSAKKHGEIEALRKKYVKSLKEKTKVNLLNKNWQAQEEQEKKLKEAASDTDDVILVPNNTDTTIDITQDDDNAADANQSEDNQGFLHADFQVIDEVRGSDNDESANKDGGNDAQISKDWDETGDDWGDLTQPNLSGDGDKNENSGQDKTTAGGDGVEDDDDDVGDDVAVADDFDAEGIAADIDAADVDWDDVNEDDLEDY